MKLLFLILALVGCNACGADEPEIDEGFQVMLGRYWRFAPDTGKFDLVESIKFGDVLDKGERGTCDIVKHQIKGKTYKETRSIVIDRIGEGLVALTFFHELGHCLHDLPHTTGSTDIMNPMRVSDKNYWTEENIDAALAKMFEGME